MDLGSFFLKTTYRTFATSLVLLRVRHLGFSEKTTNRFREFGLGPHAIFHDSILLRYANFFPSRYSWPPWSSGLMRSLTRVRFSWPRKIIFFFFLKFGCLWIILGSLFFGIRPIKGCRARWPISSPCWIFYDLLLCFLFLACLALYLTCLCDLKFKGIEVLKGLLRITYITRFIPTVSVTHVYFYFVTHRFVTGSFLRNGVWFVPRFREHVRSVLHNLCTTIFSPLSLSDVLVFLFHFYGLTVREQWFRRCSVFMEFVFSCTCAALVLDVLAVFSHDVIAP